MSAEGPDLVVAGAGGGLVGALRAAELGLDVLVVEVSEHFRRGQQHLDVDRDGPRARAPASSAAAGIDDSPDLYVADIMAQDPRRGRPAAGRGPGAGQRPARRVAGRQRRAATCTSSPTSTTRATRSTAATPSRAGTARCCSTTSSTACGDSDADRPHGPGPARGRPPRRRRPRRGGGRSRRPTGPTEEVADPGGAARDQRLRRGPGARHRAPAGDRRRRLPRQRGVPR